jgi:hypothetical protein
VRRPFRAESGAMVALRRRVVLVPKDRVSLNQWMGPVTGESTDISASPVSCCSAGWWWAEAPAVNPYQFAVEELWFNAEGIRLRSTLQAIPRADGEREVESSSD